MPTDTDFQLTPEELAKLSGPQPEATAHEDFVITPEEMTKLSGGPALAPAAPVEATKKSPVEQFIELQKTAGNDMAKWAPEQVAQAKALQEQYVSEKPGLAATAGEVVKAGAMLVPNIVLSAGKTLGALPAATVNYLESTDEADKAIRENRPLLAAIAQKYGTSLSEYADSANSKAGLMGAALAPPSGDLHNVASVFSRIAGGYKPSEVTPEVAAAEAAKAPPSMESTSSDNITWLTYATARALANKAASGAELSQNEKDALKLLPVGAIAKEATASMQMQAPIRGLASIERMGVEAAQNLARDVPHGLKELQNAADEQTARELALKAHGESDVGYAGDIESTAGLLDPAAAGAGVAAKGLVGLGAKGLAKLAPAAANNIVSRGLQAAAEGAGNLRTAAAAEPLSVLQPVKAAGTLLKRGAAAVTEPALEGLGRLTQARSTGPAMTKYGSHAAQLAIEGGAFGGLAKAAGKDDQEALTMAFMPLASRMAGAPIKAGVGVLEATGDILRPTAHEGRPMPEQRLDLSAADAKHYQDAVASLDKQDRSMLAVLQRDASSSGNKMVVLPDAVMAERSPQSPGIYTETTTPAGYDLAGGAAVPESKGKTIYVAASRLADVGPHEIAHSRYDRLANSPLGQDLINEVIGNATREQIANVRANSPAGENMPPRDVAKELFADAYGDALRLREGATAGRGGAVDSPRGFLADIATGLAAKLGGGQSVFAEGGTHGNAERVMSPGLLRRISEEAALPDTRKGELFARPSRVAPTEATVEGRSGFLKTASRPEELAAAKLLRAPDTTVDNVRPRLEEAGLKGPDIDRAEALWRQHSGIGGEPDTVVLGKIKQAVALKDASRLPMPGDEASQAVKQAWEVAASKLEREEGARGLREARLEEVARAAKDKAQADAIAVEANKVGTLSREEFNRLADTVTPDVLVRNGRAAQLLSKLEGRLNKRELAEAAAAEQRRYDAIRNQEAYEAKQAKTEQTLDDRRKKAMQKSEEEILARMGKEAEQDAALLRGADHAVGAKLGLPAHAISAATGEFLQTWGTAQLGRSLVPYLPRVAELRRRFLAKEDVSHEFLALHEMLHEDGLKAALETLRAEKNPIPGIEQLKPAAARELFSNSVSLQSRLRQQASSIAAKQIRDMLRSLSGSNETPELGAAAKPIEAAASIPEPAAQTAHERRGAAQSEASWGGDVTAPNRAAEEVLTKGDTLGRLFDVKYAGSERGPETAQTIIKVGDGEANGVRTTEGVSVTEVADNINKMLASTEAEGPAAQIRDSLASALTSIGIDPTGPVTPADAVKVFDLVTEAERRGKTLSGRDLTSLRAGGGAGVPEAGAKLTAEQSLPLMAAFGGGMSGYSKGRGKPVESAVARSAETARKIFGEAYDNPATQKSVMTAVQAFGLRDSFKTFKHDANLVEAVPHGDAGGRHMPYAPSMSTYAPGGGYFAGRKTPGQLAQREFDFNAAGVLAARQDAVSKAFDALDVSDNPRSRAAYEKAKGELAAYEKSAQK